MTTDRNQLSRHYAKLCDLRDFQDPKLLQAMHSLIPERNPAQHIERKVWEYAMVMLFLEDTGYFNDDSQVLSVGAGDERVVFWLTNHLGRVVATDIYGDGPFAGREAEHSMLDNPASHLPFPEYPWRSDRLDVRWMDARKLEFPDESFDAVFTVSSIEHFGSPEEIAQSAAEIGRVLKPGGHAFIITEYLVRRHPLNAAPVDYAVKLATRGRSRAIATPRRRAVVADTFTRRELERVIIKPSGLELMQPLNLKVSPETWSNLTISMPDGTLRYSSGEKYPMIIVQVDRSMFTSVCLPLVKPSR
ncbi:MAG: methyltransferase domain-containing protein [Solirubrobacteraceae bacterium]